jgi:hypothetical protein
VYFSSVARSFWSFLPDLDPHPGTCQSGSVSISTKCKAELYFFPENFSKLYRILENYDTNDADKKDKGGYVTDPDLDRHHNGKSIRDPDRHQNDVDLQQHCIFPVFSGQKVPGVLDQILHSHSSQPLGTV